MPPTACARCAPQPWRTIKGSLCPRPWRRVDARGAQCDPTRATCVIPRIGPRSYVGRCSLSLVSGSRKRRDFSMKATSTTMVLTLALAAASCGKKELPPPPPPEVQVVAVVQRDQPIYSEWIGTLDGMVNADIKPKVEGYLLKQLYQNGSYVKQGAPLFAIDPRQPQASLDQANGNLARAEAMHAKAQNDVRIYTPLAAERAISQQELDNARSREREGAATVDAARAAVEQARLNRAWTLVTSPIAGVVGINKAQVGD